MICRDEKRCLVSLDLDFADVLRFSPEEASGIAVIRMPRNPTLPSLELLMRQFLEALEQMSIENQLWIIEAGRIRIHQSDREVD